MILNTVSKLELLNKERNAIILGHYYKDPNIQGVADLMGVSLALAKQSTQTNTEKIINSRSHDEKIKPGITLPEDLRIQALMPLEKMLALS